ncbi:MAG: 3-phosphoshikimate 1-carboxyvinyltransferase [Planctomycetota bacterium]|nr:3-phosphoshikimate 1-carboxyvinyltransferase [Planctomycetota bacterium]
MIDYTLPLDQLPDPLPIEPLTKPFDVTITPPGSKSITCRAYVLAALAEGESKIIRPLRADDTDKLLDALCTLGAEARWAPGGEDVYIKGVAGRFPRGGKVNLGDGGTPARFMIAVACLAAEPVVVDGSKRMRERPIAEGVDMLRQLGATIEYVEEEGRLPVRVVPSNSIHGGKIEIGATKSSQFISALMLIAPVLRDGLVIRFLDELTSWPYVVLTDVVMSEWALFCSSGPFDEAQGIHSTTETVTIESQKSVGEEFQIEPDASSAMYWYYAAAISPLSSIYVKGLSIYSSQPDAGLFGMFDHCGTKVERVNDTDSRVTGQERFIAQYFDGSATPDGTLAYAASAARSIGISQITGLHTLRVKETDRLAALESELTKIGCTVSTTDDSITIDPSTRHDDPVVIETYNDHRMAMAFAVLGLARPGISIANPKCVAKSYPGFWADFAKLYQ